MKERKKNYMKEGNKNDIKERKKKWYGREKQK